MLNKVVFPGLKEFCSNELLEIAKQAGRAILEVYNSGEIAVTLKNDQSPLTRADQASNDVIVAGLKQLTPGVPVISEEEKDIPFETRRHYTHYWCVDPLDGTKEFIKRNGEFTVNIALMQHNKPVFGVIYLPVTGELYYGGRSTGSFKEESAGQSTRLKVDNQAAVWTAVGSRSHAVEEEMAVLKQYPIGETVSVGSSIKFCLIAEGKAHFYYRHGPTMEWDTAAGQAIAEGAGAVMTTPAGEPFMYNKPSLLNGSFLVKAL